MLDPQTLPGVQRAIAETVAANEAGLRILREEIRVLKGDTQTLRPRSTTSISLVGTDGGNTSFHFDPFLIQLIRVVDSSNNEHCLEVVSPSTPLKSLEARHFSEGRPQTSLGEMMDFLGCRKLRDLSHMIRPTAAGEPVSPSWVNVYRELSEWAILFSLLKKDFGTDTLIVFDGFLRSKVFAKDLFRKLKEGIQERIKVQKEQHRRNIYLAGIAKRSKVLTRYRLAMWLEGVLQTTYPAYVEVPREIEEKAYLWSEYARGDDRDLEEGEEINKFVAGKMFLVKFGRAPSDPVWAVDLFEPQARLHQTILGSMLTDATEGFPVPYYPRCLQKAHENAAIVDLDRDILQDAIRKGVRDSLGSQGADLDSFMLRDIDPASQRYE